MQGREGKNCHKEIKKGSAVVAELVAMWKTPTSARGFPSLVGYTPPQVYSTRRHFHKPFPQGKEGRGKKPLPKRANLV
jgi:hypothetical protein